MRNGMSKAAKAADYGRLRAHASRLDEALHDVLNDRVVWSGWHKDTDGTGKYRAGVSRLSLLLVTFRHPGQGDCTDVYLMDDQIDNLRRLRVNSACWQPVLEACLEARDKALNQERAA